MSSVSAEELQNLLKIKQEELVLLQVIFLNFLIF